MSDTEIRQRLGLSWDAYWESMEELDKIAMDEFSKKISPGEMLSHLKQFFEGSISHLDSIVQNGNTIALELEEIENLRFKYVQALDDIVKVEKSSSQELVTSEAFERISSRLMFRWGQ